VTERERLAARTAPLRDPLVDEVVERISQLTRELQTEIVEARMTPVWQVFDRFPRLVRDMARRLGKQVEFQVEGKEIELDRAILDEIGDPLVHLLRNAMDHGIETPEVRASAGKPAMGRVVLSAVRERASVAITVADDGRGIDRRRTLEEAQQRGLVGREVDRLSDDLLLRVLARPGFSTAAAVSEVSGRGVGIDVVSTRLRALGGSVELRTDPGAGTAFTLRVPPTLAIVRALLARVGEERYALPLAHVAETIAYRPEAVTRIDGREALSFRDQVIPLKRLGRLLEVPGPAAERGPVVVLEIGERRSGIVVDAMIGQQEIVVRPFDGPRGTLPVFTGAAILGDGMPVLILDAGGLV
jgi:two-component system chemotaxis sensor kinase CheA